MKAPVGLKHRTTLQKSLRRFVSVIHDEDFLFTTHIVKSFVGGSCLRECRRYATAWVSLSNFSCRASDKICSETVA